jgi:capsular exopolysaccharide synthesis family protein
MEPPEEQEGLKRFVETIRERLWLVIGILVLTTAAAIFYVVTADKVYEAEADLLIAPVSGEENPAYVIAGLQQESPDPTRDVETAARLATTLEVAERVKEEIGSPETAQQLQSQVRAEPIAQSDLVAILARENSADGAQALANAFAEQAVANRTAQMREQIDQRLPGLEQSLESGVGDTDLLQDQITQLEILRGSPDPTIRVETLADTPTTPVAPRPALSLAGGLFAGLILGIAAAFASQILDPRLRREEQLRRLYRLPILARIPEEPSRKNTPLGPGTLSAHSIEAYRSLRATLSASQRTPTRRGHGRVILVTGPSASEGKTTTAVNLAASLAAAGQRVIVIEADLRRPAVGRALNAAPKRGVVSALLESVPLEEALVTDTPYGEHLGLLLADYEGGWITELFALEAAERMIDEARRLADWVIIDSPPLTEVVDALPLARLVDSVLIVTRIGNSRLSAIHRLAELLAENGIKPVGFAVVGTNKPQTSGYYTQRSPLIREAPKPTVPTSGPPS